MIRYMYIAVSLSHVIGVRTDLKTIGCRVPRKGWGVSVWSERVPFSLGVGSGEVPLSSDFLEMQGFMHIADLVHTLPFQ